MPQTQTFWMFYTTFVLELLLMVATKTYLLVCAPQLHRKMPFLVCVATMKCSCVSLCLERESKQFALKSSSLCSAHLQVILYDNANRISIWTDRDEGNYLPLWIVQRLFLILFWVVAAYSATLAFNTQFYDPEYFLDEQDR